MTEIPEHLLERSRARRRALGLESGGTPAPAEGEGRTESESAPAATEGEPAAAAPAKKAAAPAKKAAAPAPKKEVALSPYARTALARKKIPGWAVPVLLFLPLWAFFYWGTLDTAEDEVAGLLALGQEVYADRCASCHAADGSGSGAIPGMGETAAVFPEWEEHAWWVINGSAAVSAGSPYGSAEVGRVSEGGMPAWGDSLSSRELLGAVFYERTRFAGEPAEELAALEALAESPELPAQLAEGTSLEELESLVDDLAGEL